MTATHAPTASAPEIVGIQYLRGLAAVMVVVAHIIGQIGRHARGGHDLTSLQSGVDIFFVISGFVMAYSTNEGTGMSPGAFMARRLIRIVPLYWLATALMVASLLVAPHLMQSAMLSWPHVIKSFLFIPAPHPRLTSNYFPLLIPGWTINFEIFFYVVFMVAMGLAAGRPGRAMALVAIALMAFAAIGFIEQPGGIAGFYTSQVILEFLFGIGLAMAVRRGARLPGPLAVLLAVGAFTVLVLSLSASHWRIIDIGLPAAALVFAAAASAVPRSRALAYLGDSSYSLYLSHGFVVSAIVQAAVAVGLMTTMVGQIAFAIAGLVASIIVGLACWYVVERPITRRLRRLLPDARRPFVSEARGDTDTVAPLA